MTIYPAAIRWLHWTTLLLILVAYGLIFWASSMPFTPEGDRLTNWHRTFGIAIWLITLLRLGCRVALGAPLPEPTLTRWQARGASLVHWLLYALLLVQPILGYLDSNLWNVPVKLFDSINLPALVPGRHPLADIVDSVHTKLGLAMLALIGLHSAAALYHHFWRRDGVLRRMLPEIGA